ncbi:methyltransferase [Fulvivirga sp. 29W222]|uniref:tRNA1(Val) (adenine(37)-N6)-methyltransferase n=1 Tax=Fulvivirga marina TaxID=2494733 RepID=A0A937FZX7_9BACT|nr:methyltransferase [Fulvivirga marina]MBL6448018.1 methyltransferase [Fulvivirga marina]
MKRRKGQFDFKQFSIKQEKSAMKVGTDGVLLGAWACVSGSKTVLDIGTGTGLIALMIAQRNPTAIIDSIEIDQESVIEATNNVMHSPWTERVRVFHESIQNFSEHAAHTYDLIVSNPPFFNSGTPSPITNRHQARHTGQLSQEDLIKAVTRLLSDSGKFCVILPVTESEHFIFLAANNNLSVSHKTIFHPKARKPSERLLIEFSRQASPFTENKLVQYCEDGSWTEEYKKLTRDFHIKL